MGMSREEIIAIKGAPTNSEEEPTHAGPAYHLDYPDATASIYYGSTHILSTTTPGVCTPANVCVGSTLLDVKAAYGSPGDHPSERVSYNFDVEFSCTISFGAAEGTDVVEGIDMFCLID